MLSRKLEIGLCAARIANLRRPAGHAASAPVPARRIRTGAGRPCRNRTQQESDHPPRDLTELGWYCMTHDNDGWLVRTTIELLGKAARVSGDAKWAMAMVSELPSIPAGRRRTWWALGGLWLLLLRQPASWPIRAVAAFGILWQGLWLWASVGILTDDAPDLPWPYNLWMVVAQSAVVSLFLLTCIRPAIGILLAVPVIPAFAAVAWQSASINGGTPPLSAALFAGPPALLLSVIAMLAVFWPLAVAAHKR